MRRHRFAPRAGSLMLNPQAFGMFFDMPEKREVKMQDGVAIVDVRGPLMHHEDFAFDSYDSIKARILDALEASAKAIVMSIDSPGGLVSGCFDTAREIRAVCAERGVPLYAYIDGQATSAAYALACAASFITIPETGVAGSIGVIDAILDVTQQDAAMGVKISFVTSGQRKTDGNPHVPTSEAALSAKKAQVDVLAGLFFAHVAEARNMSPEQVEAMQAGTLIGTMAMDAGLVDDVASLDQMLAMVVSGSVPVKSEDNMGAKASKYEECIAELRKIASGDDEAEAAKAKKMLQAELDDSDGDGSDEPGAEDAPPAPPKSDPPPPIPPKPGAEGTEDAKAIAQKALAAVTSMQEAQAKAAEGMERAALLAKRPDFTKEQAATLASAPLSIVKSAVETWPRNVIVPPAAAAMAQGTRGAGQGGADAPRLGAEEKFRLDQAMGLVDSKPGIIATEQRLMLGVPLPITEKKEG